MLIGYARVSTEDQKLDLQRDALLGAGCDRIFEEHKSGTIKNRPELERCLDALREGDTLVVWKLDRLGRNTRQLIQLADELKERGVELKSVQDQIDTNTPFGRCMYTILAAFAQLERDLISERTKAGLAAAAKQGRHGGKKHKFTAQQIFEIKTLHNSGAVDFAQVRKLLDNMSPSGVYRNFAREDVIELEKEVEFRRAA